LQHSSVSEIEHEINMDRDGVQDDYNSLRAGDGTVCDGMQYGTSLIRSKPYRQFFSEKHHIPCRRARDHKARKCAV